MSITYQQLIGNKKTDGSIRNWLNDDRIPATTILAEAEAYIYQRLLTREMLATDTTTSVAVAQETAPLPADYQNPFFFMITGAEKQIVRRRLLDEVIGMFEYDGSGNRTRARPTWYATDESNIVFNRVTDKAYTYIHKYYRRLPALAPGNQTNFLTTKYPRLLRMVYMMYGSEWKKDTQGRLHYASLAEKELDEANKHADREQYMGIEMQMQIGHDHGDYDVSGYPY